MCVLLSQVCCIRHIIYCRIGDRNVVPKYIGLVNKVTPKYSLLQECARRLLITHELMESPCPILHYEH